MASRHGCAPAHRTLWACSGAICGQQVGIAQQGGAKSTDVHCCIAAGMPLCVCSGATSGQQDRTAQRLAPGAERVLQTSNVGLQHCILRTASLHCYAEFCKAGRQGAAASCRCNAERQDRLSLRPWPALPSRVAPTRAAGHHCHSADMPLLGYSGADCGHQVGAAQQGLLFSTPPLSRKALIA